jgi:hypothetical protein
MLSVVAPFFKCVGDIVSPVASLHF